MDNTTILKQPEFVAWPKIPRYGNDTLVITEKIDGTSAQILITPEGGMYAGSRTRWITPQEDNYGFARWVEEHGQELLKLGHGRHYGEWFGCGIQRGYNLKHRQFALFNIRRPQESLPEGVILVPVLYEGENKESAIYTALRDLISNGSRVSPGYANVEGMVLNYTQSGRRSKWIINK